MFTVSSVKRKCLFTTAGGLCRFVTLAIHYSKTKYKEALSFFQYSLLLNWCRGRCISLINAVWSSFISVIVAFLHSPVFPQEIKGLYFLDDKVSTSKKLFNLFWICDIFVLHKRGFQALSKVRETLRVIPSQVQQLSEGRSKNCVGIWRHTEDMMSIYWWRLARHSQFCTTWSLVPWMGWSWLRS